MSDLTDGAFDLLQTVRKKAPKNQIGRFFTVGLVAMWYSEDEDDERWLTDAQQLLDELLAAKLIGYMDKEDPDDRYVLLPKGENYTHAKAYSTPATVNNHFSGISNSTIANMSSNVRQNIDMSTYSIEIQKEVEELREAVVAKDDTRAKRIIDGLWVSAPQLVLSMVQIALAATGGR